MIEPDIEKLSAEATSEDMVMQKRKLKKKREPNWTQTEKEALRKICVEYRHIINNKRTDNEMCVLKNQSWIKITEALRKEGYIRSATRVREAYARMKKTDKGVVVRQVSSGKETNDNVGGAKDVETVNASRIEDSDSDESNELPLAKRRWSSPLIRKRRDPFSAEQTSAMRRPLKTQESQRILFPMNATSAEKEKQPTLSKKLPTRRRLENDFETEIVAVKTEVISSEDEESVQRENLQHGGGATGRQNRQAMLDPNCSRNCLSAPSKRVANYAQYKNLPLINVDVQMDEGVTQYSPANEPAPNGASATATDFVPRSTGEFDEEAHCKAELYRVQKSAEEKRLALIDLQMEQVRLQMRYESHLFQKDLELKECKLQKMRRSS